MMTPIEKGMIIAAERELGRSITTEELELISPPGTAAELRILVDVLREAADEAKQTSDHRLAWRANNGCRRAS
jgi:hypothetical protein